MFNSQTPPHLLTLILLTALSTLSLNMFLPSLANIAIDLDAHYSTVSLAVAGYLAIAAILQLVIGPLSDRMGRRPVLLVGLVVFIVSSLVCAYAEEVWTFLLFRMLQGGIISGYVLSLAIVRDTSTEREAVGLIAYISMAMATAPMLGPMLGGILDAVFGWRANFFFYAGFGMVLLTICWMDLGETNDVPKEASSMSSNKSGDLLREPAFWAYSMCNTFSIGAFYIFLAGAPLVAQIQLGITTAEVGFYIGSITAGFMLGGLISGRLALRYDPTTLMLIGRIIACLGLLFGMISLTAGYVSPMVFFSSTIFVGLGNGLTTPSSNSGVMSVKSGSSGSAAGFSGALVVAGGAILTTLTGQILQTEEPAFRLLALMFLASALGFLFAYWAKQLRRGSE